MHVQIESGHFTVLQIQLEGLYSCECYLFPMLHLDNERGQPYVEYAAGLCDKLIERLAGELRCF